MLNYAVADIVGVYLAVGFFGAYTVLFGLCMCLILQRRSTPILLTAAAILSYTLSAIYLALDLRRVAVSYTIDPAMPWVITYSSNYDQTLGYIISYTYLVETLTADAVLIWRCYAVWGRDIRVCLVPILLWIGCGIGGFGSAWSFSHLPQTGIIGPTAQRWGNASLATAIATNVLTTSLIAGRVWWHKRNVLKAFGEGAKHTDYYDRVLAIVVESGLVYTAGLVGELVLYIMNSTGTLVIIGILSQTAGMVPTAIIVYSALGRATECTSNRTSSTLVHRSQPQESIFRGNPLASHLQRDTFEDHHLEVEQEHTHEPDYKSSPNLMWSSDPESTTDSVRIVNQTSLGESSGRAATRKRPWHVAHPPVDSGAGENASAYSTSSNDLELGMSAKNMRLTIPPNTSSELGLSVSANTANTAEPIRALLALEGRGLSFDSGCPLEASTCSCGDGDPSDESPCPREFGHTGYTSDEPPVAPAAIHPAHSLNRLNSNPLVIARSTSLRSEDLRTPAGPQAIDFGHFEGNLRTGTSVASVRLLPQPPGVALTPLPNSSVIVAQFPSSSLA